MNEIAAMPLQVSVKHRASEPAPFAWIIHRGDENAPVACSAIAYKSPAAARDAGRRALSGLKAKLGAA